MFFKGTTLVTSAFICSLSLSAFAAIQVGDHASYDTHSKLTMDDKVTEDHFTIMDTAKDIGDNGIQFEEVKKTDKGTTTDNVTYSEAHWLMLPGDAPQTAEDAIKQCESYANSKKVSVPLKSGNVDGCEVTQVDDAFHLTITYAPVPLYIYHVEYQDEDGEGNHFELSQQYQEVR